MKNELYKYLKTNNTKGGKCIIIARGKVTQSQNCFFWEGSNISLAIWKDQILNLALAACLMPREVKTLKARESEATLCSSMGLKIFLRKNNTFPSLPI